MPPGRTSMIAGACNVMYSQLGPDNIYEKNTRPESPNMPPDVIASYSIEAILCWLQ